MKEYDVKITEMLEKDGYGGSRIPRAAEEQVERHITIRSTFWTPKTLRGVAFGTTEEREVRAGSEESDGCASGKAVHVSAGCADRL